MLVAPPGMQRTLGCKEEAVHAEGSEAAAQGGGQGSSSPNAAAQGRAPPAPCMEHNLTAPVQTCEHSSVELLPQSLSHVVHLPIAVNGARPGARSTRGWFNGGEEEREGGGKNKEKRRRKHLFKNISLFPFSLSAI